MRNVMFHTGLLAVYPLALSAGADAAFQFPSCAVLPAILIVSPGTVVTRWVNDTATAVGQTVEMVLPAEVEVVRRVVGVPVVGVADEASSTTGSPFVSVTHASPLPLDVTTAPLP